ncbi:MAG: MFS transporter [Lachnospiraceae bacterium]|nr:MFS transporter [Lachnospiraceae bacterium]
MEKGITTNKLWTHDFTIITFGSLISMLGNAMSGFAMSLMVLDFSGSTLLYALYLASYTVPQLVVPIFSGAVLDRFSRKKTIYTLDFCSAGLYLLLAVILWRGWFSFPLFLAYSVILGSIQSTYMVAYDSFYPMLITEGNYQKAYSIAGFLENMSFFMIPIATFLYKMVGITPLLVFDAASFLIVAIMETRIRAGEDYIEKQKATRREDVRYGKQVLIDLREGFDYLLGERGLLAITAYFFFSFISTGVTEVIGLPYFKENYHNGEYVYMLVWGMSVVGRGIGGLIHYKFKLPANMRYTIALIVYVSVSLLEGFYLFVPVPVMMLFLFGNGILGVTSYTIRISATQSYVPDEKKGRYNGVFNMLASGGMLLGQLVAGGLTVVMPERIVLMVAMLVTATMAVVIIGGNKKAVSEIYNRKM